MSLARQILVALALIWPGLAASALAAATLERLVTHDSWSVFVLKNGATRTCYAATPAQVFQPSDNLRQQPYLYITRYPASAGTAARHNTVEVRFGMDASDLVKPTATIIARNPPPRSTFPVKTENESGRIVAQGDEEALLQGMIKGRAIRVSKAGAEDDDEALKDIYSLYGVTKALRSLESACP